MAQAAGITLERTLRDVLMINKKKVTPKNLTITENLPRGYVTLENFREQGLQMINELCDKYDID